MAFKQSASLYDTVEATEFPKPGYKAQFSCPGLREVGEGRFELDGVTELRVEWSRVTEKLMEAGIPQEEAELYTERCARMIERGELARVLAARMERVG